MPLRERFSTPRLVHYCCFSTIVGEGCDQAPSACVFAICSTCRDRVVFGPSACASVRCGPAAGRDRRSESARRQSAPAESGFDDFHAFRDFPLAILLARRIVAGRLGTAHRAASLDGSAIGSDGWRFSRIGRRQNAGDRAVHHSVNARRNRAARPPFHSRSHALGEVRVGDVEPEERRRKRHPLRKRGSWSAEPLAAPAHHR